MLHKPQNLLICMSGEIKWLPFPVFIFDIFFQVIFMSSKTFLLEVPASVMIQSPQNIHVSYQL